MKYPAILITCKSENKTWHNLFLIPGYAKMLSVKQITKQHAEGAIYFGLHAKTTEPYKSKSAAHKNYTKREADLNNQI
jgi:hypothetical protein